MPPEGHRYAPLDGLRGLAIAAVFWFHYRIAPHSPGEWGWAGVDLFSVLSGFLITGILLDSLGEDHYKTSSRSRRRSAQTALKARVPAWPVHVATFAWVWLLSWTSFRCYGTPFLRLKNRWGGGGENSKAVPVGEARAA